MTDEQYFHRWHRHLPPKAMAREAQEKHEEEEARFNALPWLERYRIKKQKRLEEKRAKEAEIEARFNALHQHW